ncbi:hypothetical protein ACFWP3_37995 [Streptomyces sp. NPDC058525]|uniref:hypothetical protein n=1 Tax=Streptomyces sp. NPDC058525 TaxID=3346538 RepID=UPI00364E2E82
MNTSCPPNPPATRLPASQWWLAPALLTMAAALAGAWGYRSNPLIHGSAWLTVPYIVPAALVTASWRPPTRTHAKTRALALGSAGALIALTYAHLATFTLYTAALVLWAFQGGG